MKNTLPLFIIGLGTLFASVLSRNVWATPENGLIYEPYFKQVEQKNNLPPGLLSRMAYQESRYNPNAAGASGEIGIMQIIPRWHPGVNAANPVDSIFYAGALMRKYYNEFKSWPAAIAAYNWGVTNMRNKGLEQAPESTKRYIRDVLGDIGL